MALRSPSRVFTLSLTFKSEEGKTLPKGNFDVQVIIVNLAHVASGSYKTEVRTNCDIQLSLTSRRFPRLIKYPGLIAIFRLLRLKIAGFSRKMQYKGRENALRHPDY